jgi:hypothetical protein
LIDDYTFWMTPEQKARHKAQEKAEKLARDKFERRIRKAIEEAAPIMGDWGDGVGGEMQRIFEEEMLAVGLLRSSRPSNAYAKQPIGRKLSKAVFERDEYRCVSCGSHIDLCCDHIISEHDGGPTTLDNLQTMCRSCNSSKGKKSFSVLRGKAA